MAWCNKFKQCKVFKEQMSKESMPVAWHLTRWWDWCVSEEKKKERNPFF